MTPGAQKRLQKNVLPDRSGAIAAVFSVAAIILVVLAVWLTEGRAQEEIEIRCHEGRCLIAQAHLQQLIEVAKRVLEYRNLCGWEK